MQAQWHTLRTKLTSNSVEAITNLYFQRLLKVLEDPKSGRFDKTKAYYDALASAHAHGITTPSLPLIDSTIQDVLTESGLKKHAVLPDEIQIDDKEICAIDNDIYGLKQRRFFVKPKMDVFLSAKLNDECFSVYKGRGQQIAIRVLLTSPDDATLFVNLPTGCGKTLLIHSLMLIAKPHRLNLVIVPTVALAIEQGDRAAEVLKKTNQCHGGPYAWFGNQNQEMRARLREKLNSGTQRVLFCSPEAVRGSLLHVLYKLAKHDQLEALIVDEAHLVDQWGAGFRPDFQLLAPLAHSLSTSAPKGIRKVLMSATFSPNTLHTLKNMFSLPGDKPIVVNASFLRPEPSYYQTQVGNTDEYKRQVIDQLFKMPRPLILYATKVEDAEDWYERLLRIGYKRVGLFHGRTSTCQREKLINKWRNDELDIMVATSAFGVGMNKNDVRSVLHVAVPENLDRFYQECGRGGRDGKACMAHLIYHHGQIEIARNINQERLISTELGFERWKYMYHAQLPGSKYFKVDLTTQHKKIQYKSQKNIAWNWRTLLLMRRSGFIDILFEEPQFPEEAKTEAEISEYFQKYFTQVGVKILHDGHLDKKVWDKEIGAQRSFEFAGRSAGFNKLIGWLKNPDKDLCVILSDFYTLDGYQPESSCGGCPGCREKGLETFTPTLGLLIPPIEGWSTPENHGIGAVRRIHYHGQGLTIRSFLHNWKHLVAFLLQNFVIKAIRAQSEFHEMLYKILSVDVFWCALSPDEPDSIWDELVLIAPDETSFPKTTMSGYNRIYFIPDHIQDPTHPFRRWIDCDQHALAIDDYEKELRYVDYQQCQSRKSDPPDLSY
jgi:ATP-dependent DNA helicase RecQ